MTRDGTSTSITSYPSADAFRGVVAGAGVQHGPLRLALRVERSVGPGHGYGRHDAVRVQAAQLLLEYAF